MKIKDFIDKKTNIGELKINDRYHLFIEELSMADNEKDILIELFEYVAPNESEYCCNCLDYKDHHFTSETDIEIVRAYALEVVRRYENKN